MSLLELAVGLPLIPEDEHQPGHDHQQRCRERNPRMSPPDGPGRDLELDGLFFEHFEDDGHELFSVSSRQRVRHGSARLGDALGCEWTAATVARIRRNVTRRATGEIRIFGRRRRETRIAEWRFTQLNCADPRHDTYARLSPFAKKLFERHADVIRCRVHHATPPRSKGGHSMWEDASSIAKVTASPGVLAGTIPSSWRP